MRMSAATILTLSLNGLLAACGGGNESKPAAPPAKADAAVKDDYKPHEHGGLPGLADALKGDLKKEEEARPADAAKPAESAKPAEAAQPADAAKPAEAAKSVEPAKK